MFFFSAISSLELVTTEFWIKKTINTVRFQLLPLITMLIILEAETFEKRVISKIVKKYILLVMYT